MGASLSWGHSFGKAWGVSFGHGDTPRGDGSGVSNSGPDAQLSFSDYMRRFGPKNPKRLPVYADDEEAIVLLLCAIAAETYG